MSKWFGGGSVGAVTIVEAPVSQWYERRARIALFVGSIVSGLVAFAVLVTVSPVLWAVVFAVLAGGLCGLLAAVLVRVWPVLRVLWWWSVEIAVTVFVVAGSAVLGTVTRWWVPWLVVPALVALGAVVGPVRRRVVAWSWCVAVRHRLRLCFVRLIRAAGAGGSRPVLLPLVLWARSTPAGERVWLWLRPGLSLADLDGKTDLIAVTCWATEVRVTRASARFAALVRIDVHRRDPLVAVVASPLALLIPRRSGPAPVLPTPDPVGLDLADIPEPVSEPVSRGGRR